MWSKHKEVVIILVISAVLLQYTFSSLWSNAVSWQFSAFYDDQHNFFKAMHLQTLFPPKDVSIMTHWLEIMSNKGINVHEPFYNLVKAALVDLVGRDAILLRYCSLFLHLLNGALVYYWLSMLFTSVPKDCKSLVRYKEAILVLAVLVFLLHPLNMEVIGWLSAQSYFPSLSSSLLASILLEWALQESVAIDSEGEYKDSRGKVRNYLLLVLVFFSLAVMSKAPAITLVGTHIIRTVLFIMYHQKHRTYEESEVLKGKNESVTSSFPMLVSFAIFLILHIALSFVLLFGLIYKGNEGSVGDINLVRYLEVETKEQGFGLTMKLLRALITIGSFIMRFFFPVDLRSHYHAPPEYHFTWNYLFNIDDSPEFILHLICTLIVICLAGFYLVEFVGSVFSPQQSKNVVKYQQDRAVDWQRQIIVLSLASYLGLWLPGAGIIQHGWTQLGADRYNYLPLAYVSPLVVLCLYHVLEQLAISHISVLSIFFEEECIGQSDTALSPTNNAGQLSPPASPLRNTKAAHSTHMNEKKSEKKTTSGSTAAKKKQFPFVSFFAVSLLACSIFLLGLAFATISKLHLQAWGNDETFLTRCVRMDPKDWECSQYLSSWYHNQGNNVELAKYFNEVAIYSLPVEPPRLAMFKASLMIQTPYQVSDSQFVAYQAIHNPQLAKKIVITNNRTHYNNQALACGVVDTVILRLAEKLEERFTALNGSFTMPVELQATTTSADLAFSKIFSIAEMFEKVEKSLIPMIVSNKVTCVMLQVGLQVDTASRALQLMRISFEKLQFGEELTAFIESHPELIVDGKELKLPLYYEHIHAWNVHIKNLEHWLQTQQGGYQAALLH